MPEKSVREMNRLQRQHYSLSTRVFRASLMGSVILSIAALIIGVGLYSYALLQQHTVEAYHLTQNAEIMLSRVTNIESLAQTGTQDDTRNFTIVVKNASWESADSKGLMPKNHAMALVK